MPVPAAHGENEHRHRHRRGASLPKRGGRPRGAGAPRGALFLLRPLGPRAAGVRGVGGRARPPALLRPEPPRPPASGAPTRPRSRTGWSRAALPRRPSPRKRARPRWLGVRYCPLSDRVAAHVYYGGHGSGIVSVFLLSGPARIGDGWSGTARGLHVRLVRAAGRTLAVVGESADDVATTARSFVTTVATATPRTASPVDRSRSSC